MALLILFLIGILLFAGGITLVKEGLLWIMMAILALFGIGNSRRR